MGINISGLGIANAIGFKSRISGGGRDKPFLPPNIQSSLVSVISTYGKKNTDSDRDTLKDLTGKGNDFKLFGFDFTETSGYSPYETNYINLISNEGIKLDIHTSTKISGYNSYDTGKMAIKESVSDRKFIPSYKIKVSNLVNTIRYYYINPSIPNSRTPFSIEKDGIYELPASYNDKYTGENVVNLGFAFDGNGGGATIEQFSNFEHWLVTDGIKDFIESVKPMSEMLEGSDSYTVISIIHQIELNQKHSLGLTNYICYNDSTSNSYVRNTIKENIDTGIYGYQVSPSLFAAVKDILGDKNNISITSYGTKSKVLNGKFSVVGYRHREGTFNELSKIAYAGTIIANRVLTYDEIYQVIEYYNLDRPGEIIKPSMLYDIRKQGITNANHAEFNDELIDYINGYNIRMYNMLWDKQSGIGNYPISFKDYTYLPARGTVEINRDSFVITSNTSTANLLEVNTRTKVLPAYKVKIEGTSTIKEGNLKWRINTTSAVTTYVDVFEDGIYDIPAAPQTEEAAYSGWCISKYNESVNVKVTLLAIDDITDAIVLNGIDNFGKVIDIPIWKDYTICALRKWLRTTNGETGGIISKSIQGQDGAFIVEQSLTLTSNKTSTYNFGTATGSLTNTKLNDKSFAIQTKYTYDVARQTLSVGSGLDTSRLWLGTIRDGDNRFSYLALWNLMLFPYTMSNFILERQLKKYKLGSLYPDNSFPFRPIVTSNGSTNKIQYFDVATGKAIAVGDHITKEQQIQLNIMLNGIDEVIKITVDGKEIPLYSYNDGYYRYRFNVRNSYPKIDITIQEYVKYDDIAQPYPVIFVLQNKETGKELTYGDYIKVGDIIKVKSAIFDLADLYEIGGYSINSKGNYAWSQIQKIDIEVTKPLRFGSKSSWKLSCAEPLFIYDPASFTNSTIKTLGYLPDISGQNRHLKLYNFSYEGMSGKDGYPVVLGNNKTWDYLRPENNNWKYGSSSTSITIYKALNTAALLFTIIRQSGGTIKSISIPSFKVNISGLQNEENIRYRYISNDNPSTYTDITITKNGEYELPACVPLQSDSTISDAFIGFQVKLNNNESVKGLVIKILPDYKDSLYFNGVTNSASVLNLDHGGKCLVTKINYKFNQETICIYDQRKNTLEENIKKFALLATQQSDIAYGNGLEGNTYINNVLNNYVKSSELENVEHVATLVSSVVTDSNTNTPLFGRNVSNQHYAQFAMYRTILLPEVPNASDRAILNKWCGLPTGYLPKPEYYWDVTGKSNSDTATRNTIKNLGTAKPVASTSDEDAYSLENKNVAYEGMSGYNGYPVVFGANKTWENLRIEDDNLKYELSSNSITVYKILPNSGAIMWSYIKENEVIKKIEIPSFIIRISGLKNGEKVRYYYVSENNTSKNAIFDIIENGTHVLPKCSKLEVTESTPSNNIFIGFVIILNDNSSTGVTIEILPEYPNGLCLDGITNYIECANVPAFTDYTYILMRQILSNSVVNSLTMHKGKPKTFAGAFTSDYVINNDPSEAGGNINEFAFHSFGAVNVILRSSVANKVIWANTTSVNGIAGKRGSNTDDESITIAKWETNYRKMAFYKLMLWSKSINNTYHINMLRNLIYNGGIINLNDSIFDQTSNE